MAAVARRGARTRQERVFGGRRGKFGRDAPALVLPYGAAGRRGLYALAHLLRARPLRGDDERAAEERAGKVPDGDLLVLRAGAALHLRRGAHAGLREPPLHRPRRRRLPVRLPVREAARLVLPLPRRAPAHDGRAHEDRPQTLPREEQHRLLLRHRRLRVHPLLRSRVAREVSGPDDGAQGERGERLYGARHPYLHLPPPCPGRDFAESGIVGALVLELQHQIQVYSFATHQPWPGGYFLASRLLRWSGISPRISGR